MFRVWFMGFGVSKRRQFGVESFRGSEVSALGLIALRRVPVDVVGFANWLRANWRGCGGHMWVCGGARISASPEAHAKIPQSERIASTARSPTD